MPTPGQDTEPTGVSGTFLHRPMLFPLPGWPWTDLPALLLLSFAVLRPVVRWTAIRQAEIALASSQKESASGPAGPPGPPGPEGVPAPSPAGARRPR